MLDNPLTNEHVLISPHRAKRPWQGQTEASQGFALPPYDPSCYLCPGNTRAGGAKNPVYTQTMRFENDYAAVLHGPAPEPPLALHPLFIIEPVHGACDVICFHPRHDLTLARIGLNDLERVIGQWLEVYAQRGQQDGIQYVQIFEVHILPSSV